MKRALVISVVLSVVLIGSLGFLYIDDYNNSIPKFAKIGMLFPTADDLSTTGEESFRASLLAIDDFNQYLKNQKASWELVGIQIESAASPEKTLEIVKEFHKQGIDIIIGP